jgi:hypothetical protein
MNRLDINDNCKLSNVPSGIAITAQPLSQNYLHLLLKGGAVAILRIIAQKNMSLRKMLRIDVNDFSMRLTFYVVAFLAYATSPASGVAQEPHQTPPRVEAFSASGSVCRDLQALVQTRLEAERSAIAQPGLITVDVDDRMELLTVIFRLAGAPEFAGDNFVSYAASVDARFRAYAQHPAVMFARRMREEVGIGADGVVVLAAHLSPLPLLEPPKSFAGTAVQGRWRSADAMEFAALASHFARESNFDAFVRENRPIYELAALRMRKLVQREIQPNWFAEYFGERPNSSMHVAIGLLNGNISLGFDAKLVGQPDVLYAVIGTWLFDEEKLPVYDATVTPILVHEFCHSFVDPAFVKRVADFEAVGVAIQPALAEHLPRMRQYYWRTLFEESLVRAAVARYLLALNEPEAARKELAQQVKNGFVWIDGVYVLLEEYEQNRDHYPTFEKFLPRVIDFFMRLPEQMPKLVEAAGRSAGR